MFCNNCGNNIADDAMFCTCCGVRMNREQPEAVVAENAPTVESAPASGHKPDNDANSTRFYDSIIQELRAVEAEPEPAEKPKTFFGVGAFVLCLIVIAILSVSTGVFAGLYFTLC